MDALCLHALIREAQPVLRGAKIGRAVQPDRWSLLVTFQRGRGPGGLLLSVRPDDLIVALLSPPRAAPDSRSRFADLFVSRTKGALVERVEQLGLERIVALHVSGTAETLGAMTLYAEMLGPRGGFVLVDRTSGRVIGRHRPHSRHGIGQTAGLDEAYRPPPDRGRVDPRSVGAEEFCRLVAAGLAGGTEPARLLVSRFTGFSPMMATDLVARAGLSPIASTIEQARSLWNPFADLISRLSRGEFEPRVLLGNDGEPSGLAVFPLVTIPADRQVAYATMSEAIAAYCAGRAAVVAREAVRAALLRRLRQQIATAARLSVRLEKEAALYQEPDLYARKGQLLLANRSVIRRGERVIALPDHGHPNGRALEIELDLARSIEENARRYFALHRKAKRGAEIVKGRLAEAAGRLQKLQDLIGEVQGAMRLEVLQRIDAAVGPMRRRPPTGEKRGPNALNAAGPEPRVFNSSDGLPILVGRSGPGNDRLTWRLARPHDLWLHAQGISGSHVVVRLEKGKQVPPRTLREAAQIAAYYSRARGEAKVPVDYALRKYVRKPKASPPGVVLLSREKTIVVQPDPGLVRRLHPTARQRDSEV
jgi:predicted ribosome quality control (RQC) complex YloA/Tae2 family protein